MQPLPPSVLGRVGLLRLALVAASANEPQAMGGRSSSRLADARWLSAHTFRTNQVEPALVYRKRTFAVREFANKSAASAASLDYVKFQAVIQSAASAASLRGGRASGRLDHDFFS